MRLAIPNALLKPTPVTKLRNYLIAYRRTAPVGALDLYCYNDDSILARVPLPSGFSMSRSKNRGLRFCLMLRRQKSCF